MDRRTLLKASIAATAAVALPALSFGTRKAPAGGSFRFPATPVGRAFRQWLEAYNAADIEALRAFHRVYSQAEEVEGRTAMDLLFRSETGGIDPYAVVRSGKYRLMLSGYSRLTEIWMESQMTLASQPPHRSLGQGGRPIPPPGDRALGKPLSLEKLGAELDRYLAKLSAADAFSGTVLVAKEGETLYAKAVGMADVAAGVPTGVETKFNLGSMNKMVTAVAVAQLMEQGRSELHEPTGAYLSGLPSAVAERVTLHQLLTHTSGLGDFFGPRFEQVKETLRSPRDYFPLFMDQRLRFEPGSAWDYSNAGFIVLGAIVEALSGQDYFAYVREHIYGPARMTASDSYEKTERVPDLARGYTRPLPPDPADLRAADVLGPRVDNYEILPRMGSSAGGGYSTATDLLRFHQALRTGRLVSPETAGVLMTGKEPLRFSKEERYAYGFQEERYLGTRISGHGGGFPGVSSKLDIYLDLGYTVVVLSNIDGGARPVAAKIREMLVRE